MSLRVFPVIVAALVSCALAAAGPSPATPLSREQTVRPGEPISGLAAIVARRDINYLVIGESHGTREIPAFFGDLVAQAQLSRPIVAALELPATEADRIERYLRSPGGEDDRRGLLDGEFWRSTFKDGRSSQAIADLIEKLRQLRQGGWNGAVAYCQPDARVVSKEPYEQAMALCWKAASDASPDALVMALVGNAHASKAPIFDVTPAAAWLPPGQAVALDVISASGASWNCDDQGCGAHPTAAEDLHLPRGLHWGKTRKGGPGAYDGVFSIGDRFSASPPASAPLPTPLSALLDDPIAARAFDYASLRPGRDQAALAALTNDIGAAVMARANARPEKCQTAAEVLVWRGVSGAFASDAKAWRSDWAQAMTALDRMTADMKTSLTAPLGDLPPADPTGLQRRFAQDATDPRLKELHDRAAVDQAARSKFGQTGGLSAEARQIVMMVISSEICEIDHDNTTWLKDQIRVHGWFVEDRYGLNASGTAWLLVRHADRGPEFQREVLPLLAKATSSEGRKNYAYLADRVAMNAKLPQTYGTQGQCTPAGEWQPLAVIDPPQLDARRASVGLPPLAEYKLTFKAVCPRPRS
jgi:hypothetical protein